MRKSIELKLLKTETDRLNSPLAMKILIQLFRYETTQTLNYTFNRVCTNIIYLMLHLKHLESYFKL